MKFANDFLMGAATAAHQVEGNNVHSDCWAMENMENSTYAEPSLDAVDHYNLYEEDIALMARAGLNAYRFSIEWARIEPQEGLFDEAEIEHYRDVIRCCKKNGIEPIVTLHHFSSPKWLIGKGGWEADTTPADFAKYVRFVMERLGSEIQYVCTINEANMGIQIAVIAKKYMMQMMAKMADASTDGTVQVGMDLEKLMASSQADAASQNMEVFGVEKVETFTSPRTGHGDMIVMEAHTAARKVIREVAPHVKVGLTLSLHDVQPVLGGEGNAAKEWEDEFTHYLSFIADDDFLGVQNYTRSQVGADGPLPAPAGAELTQMDYEFYPEALENVLRAVSKDYKGELIVTENGIATADDTRRVEFIRRALDGIQNCISDGIPVKGYCYWSLLDNFEWQKGYSMTFGLIAVDRTTQARYPKESLAYLGSFCGR